MYRFTMYDLKMPAGMLSFTCRDARRASRHAGWEYIPDGKRIGFTNLIDTYIAETHAVRLYRVIFLHVTNI